MFAACFYNIFTIFLQYFYNTCYNMFTRRVFTMVFTIIFAERFYNVFTLFSFYKYLFHLNSRFLHYVSPFSFYSFYNVHTQGKIGVAGSPLFIRYEFFILFLKSISQQLGLPLLFVTAAGNFVYSFGEGRGDGVYLYY